MAEGDPIRIIPYRGVDDDCGSLVSLTESFVDQLDQVFRLQVLHVGTSC